MRQLAQTPAAQLSLRELARDAKVSHTAPYHYFTDRQGLIRATGVEAMRRLLEEQTVAVQEAHTARDQLLALGGAYIGFAAREPHAFALVFDPQYCQPGAPTQDMAPLIEANEALLANCVLKAQAQGVLPAGEALPIITALWGTVHGLAQLVMAGHIGLEAAQGAVGALLPSAANPQ